MFATGCQAGRKSGRATDAGMEASREGMCGVLFERLAKSSQGRATGLDLAAQAAGLACIAAATLAVCAWRIWG